MREDIKRCFKLIKYSYKYRDENYTCMVMFVVGILIFLMNSIGETTKELPMGISIFLVVIPTGFIKAIFSLPYSHMVCSSGKRRMIEVIFPNLWSVVSSCCGYLVFILLIKGVYLQNFPAMEAEIGKWMIWSSLIHTAAMLFYSVSTRLFWQGLLLMILSTIVISLASGIWEEAFASCAAFGPAAIISFIITLVGVLFSCVFKALVYKLPMVRGNIGKKMLTQM